MALCVKFTCPECGEQSVPFPDGRKYPTTTAESDSLRLEFVTAHEVQAHVDLLAGPL